jgi:collagen type I/II/III/V/XI/XXIV/XXVII alpha
MKKTRPHALAILGAVLIAVAVSACGGSSSKSTTTAAAATKAADAPNGATGTSGATGATGSARLTALVACLKKYGVTLPTGRFGRAFGGTGRFGPTGRFGATGASGRFGPTGRFGASGGRGFFGRGATGTTGPSGRVGFAGNSKLATALRKCGGFGAGGFGAGRFGAGGATGGFSAGSATDRAEVVSYETCMKQHGVTLPAPNFSGSGSVFKGVSTTTAAFRTANAQCQSLLKFLPGTAATGTAG